MSWSEDIPKVVQENLEVQRDIKVNGTVHGKNQCTAWCSFDGTTTPPTIRDSYNVSDVVRTGTGQYDVYFEEEMDNADISCSGMCTDLYSTNLHMAQIAFKRDGSSPLSKNKVEIETNFDGQITTLANMHFVALQVFGGKN